MISSVISSINVQAIKALGRSDVILILEFIKKPLFVLIVLACVFVSPVAMAWGAVVYGVVSCFVNYFPNVRILNYSFYEQISDVAVSFLLSALMALPVYFLGKIRASIYLLLAAQILCGIFVYVMLSIIFRVQSFYEIKEMIMQKIKIKKSYFSQKTIGEVKNERIN